MGYIMALDQGTTSSRAFIYDENFRIIASSQKPVGICYPKNGWVEQNPEEIWDSIVTVGREVISKAGIDSGQIDAIGITNQRETSLLWNNTRANRSTMPSYGKTEELLIFVTPFWLIMRRRLEKRPAW